MLLTLLNNLSSTDDASIITSVKYVRKSKIIRTVSSLYQQTAFIDDDYELPVIKGNQVVARTIQKPVYQPDQLAFFKAIENGSLKTSNVLKSIAEKIRVDADMLKKEQELKAIEAKRLQDEEDESVLMLMFEMM